jgi:hypothetical protein
MRTLGARLAPYCIVIGEDKNGFDQDSVNQHFGCSNNHRSKSCRNEVDSKEYYFAV